MEHIAWQLNRFREGAHQTALIWRDRETTYGELTDLYHRWRDALQSTGIQAGDSVGVVGDYSPSAISCLLASLGHQCILVPLAWESQDQHSAFFEIAELDHLISFGPDDEYTVEPLGHRRNHPLLEQLRESQTPGLLLFSSGSTGEPKAILHSLPRFLKKFRKPRHTFRTINFLLFDHIGGVNTMFYTLANLGCTVVPEARTVAAVSKAIERHRVELLPTSPSFLNLMLLQEAHRQHDLGSLKLITYGTEVMSEQTLQRAVEAFPHARFQQTYGLSELGILRSKSRADGSLFVKVGGEDYQARVVNGTLQIRATSSSMVGYLNAPSPFDGDGWFDTGDAVIQEGEYYRILGRNSDIINVGGQKVYPAEVEKVLAEMPGVIEVTVRGEPHMILGQVVGAAIQAQEAISSTEMKRRVVAHCKGRLQPFMIPAKVRVVKDSPVNYRFKKVRR